MGGGGGGRGGGGGGRGGTTFYPNYFKDCELTLIIIQNMCAQVVFFLHCILIHFKSCFVATDCLSGENVAKFIIQLSDHGKHCLTFSL